MASHTIPLVYATLSPDKPQNKILVSICMPKIILNSAVFLLAFYFHFSLELKFLLVHSKSSFIIIVHSRNKQNCEIKKS